LTLDLKSYFSIGGKSTYFRGFSTTSQLNGKFNGGSSELNVVYKSENGAEY